MVFCLPGCSGFAGLSDMVEIPFEVIFLIFCTHLNSHYEVSLQALWTRWSFCILLVLQFGNRKRNPVSMQKICKCTLRLMTETRRVWHPFQAVCQISMNGFLKINSLHVRETNFFSDLGISYLVPGPFFTMLQSGWSNSIIALPYF